MRTARFAFASLLLAASLPLVAGCGGDAVTAALDGALCDGGDCACVADEGCPAAAPRCDPASSRCVPCLPERDNCPGGQRCVSRDGAWGCAPTCARSADCAATDGGAPQDCCDGTCVDTRASALHCGGCNAACPVIVHGSPACVAGACGVGSCAAGWGDCDGRAETGCETEIAADPKNCGACAKACPAAVHAAVACESGSCKSTCEAAFADCDGKPETGCETDLAADPKNCGACATDCGAIPNATTACNAGACAITGCLGGYADCDNRPANGCEAALGSDAANCGGCARACVMPNGVAVCVNGVCGCGGCEAGFADCDGVCVNGCETPVVADVGNCGGCGKVCSRVHATPACQAGACSIAACEGGWSDCDGKAETGCESATAVDPANCGGCGKACPAAPNVDAICANGVCQPGTCRFAFADCNGQAGDGCEASLLDPKSCGMCGNVCAGAANAAAACHGGQCAYECNAFFGDCDNLFGNGCETTLAADMRNCGACGKICAPAHAVGACLAGQCGIVSCEAGWSDCDKSAANGYEANLNGDRDNCGACGSPCGNGLYCVSGVCQQVPRCPNVMLIVDRSGSTSSGPNGTASPSKWSIEVAAVNAVLQVYGQSAPFGLQVFDSNGAWDNAGCYNNTAITVEPAPNNGGAIMARLQVLQPNGGTNTGEAVRRAGADPAMADPNRGNVAIVLTDGVPNCNSGDNVAPYAFTITEIKAAAARVPGLPTVMVGFDGNGDAQIPYLNNAAAAGGLPIPGCNSGNVPCYHGGRDQAAFAAGVRAAVERVLNVQNGVLGCSP